METKLPSEVELPMPIDVVNANVLDVLTELSLSRTDSIPGGQDQPLMTHKITDLHGWRKVGYCGEIRLIKYTAQSTRMRLVKAAPPSDIECYEWFLGKSGATKEQVESELFRILFQEKYNRKVGLLDEYEHFREFETAIWHRFIQVIGQLVDLRQEIFLKVVSRLAQVLKFNLEVPPQTGGQTWGETGVRPPDDQAGRLVTVPTAAPINQPGVVAASNKPDAAYTVPAQLLPAFAIAKAKYKDFSYETACRILEGLPKAFQKYQSRGGRWGPRWVSEEIGINSTTLSRYFAAFHAAGIDQYQGISMPYKPRK
jgi:hypothetical protein